MPPDNWETFDFQGRPFYRFELHVRDERTIPFNVAQQIAGRYDVLDVLARGGGGLILIARDVKTSNAVLIKALTEYRTTRHDLTQPVEDVVESLRRTRHHLQTERRILVQLRNNGCESVPHPNDYVFDSNPVLAGPQPTLSGEEWHFDEPELITSEPYLVMQHVAGMSLKDVLENVYRHGLEETVALRIIDQVAHVIELLEQPLQLTNGQTWDLIYQDLKPANIMVDEFGHATVLDFGGCQLSIDDTLVLHGQYSPGHCAPECGQGGQAISHAADAYGLGSTLFNMLTGQDPRSLLPKNAPPGAPRAVHIGTAHLNGRCATEVVGLIAKCVDWDPSARYQSASEFRAALKPLLHWT